MCCCKAFATMLPASLRVVYLCKCCCRSVADDTGAKKLAGVLRTSQNITEVNLRGHSIGDAGLALLAPAIGALPKLKLIDVVQVCTVCPQLFALN